MPKKTLMTPGTINTILNTAPMIIQGATRLVKMIRERGDEEEDNTIPDTIDGLKQELEKIETRLDAVDESSVEQIKLIEELAKQNEALAESLKKTMGQLTVISVLAIMALIFAAIAMYSASN